MLGKLLTKVKWICFRLGDWLCVGRKKEEILWNHVKKADGEVTMLVFTLHVTRCKTEMFVFFPSELYVYT